MPPISKVSVLLNGGIDEQASPELAGPVASQGASITLRASNNTRLSTERGTCTRAPSVSLCASSDSPIHGMVSCSAGRNTVAWCRAGVQASKILASDGTSSSAGAGDLLSSLNGYYQSCYLPAQITAAGAIPSVAATSPPATCFDPTNQWYWTAYYGLPADGTNTSRIYVTITDTEGGVIVPATVVDVFPGTTNGWLGITAHGTNGVMLWTQVTNAISWGKLIRTGTSVSILGGSTSNTPVAPTTDATPAAVISGLLIDSAGAIDTTFQDYAYLVSSQPLFPNNGYVTKVNILTNAHTSSIYVGALAGDGSASVALCKSGSSYYLGVGFHATTLDTTTMTTLNPSTMAPLTLASAAGAVDRIRDTAAQFLLTTGVSGNRLVVATSAADGSFSDTTYAFCGTFFYTMLLGSSAMSTFANVPWTAIRSHGSTVKFSATEQYPVFDLVPYYGEFNESPLEGDYVLDPSAVLYLVGGQTLASPVARFGCVRGNIAPIRVANPIAMPHGCTSVGTKVRCTYLKDIVGSSGQEDYPARYVEIDFTPFQPAVAQDKDGVAMVAAALPVQWDGTEVVELGGPLFQPKLRVIESGGSGTAYPAGAYQFSTYFSWTDAGGLEHRTAPVLQNHTSVGGSPQTYTTLPVSLRNGVTQVLPDALLFVSELNGATQYLLPDRPFSVGGVLQDDDVSDPDSSRKQLYTTLEINQEQGPQPPPPAHDICIIGDRCWILDAEIRSRVVHSKRRVSGRGFEFHPAYEILLPSGAGKTTAVREWQGSTIVFCEFAIYQIAGEGPDNLVGNPSGGTFSKPIQVAAVGCANRLSVLVTPKGILFQRDNDVMLFTGGEPQPVPGIQPDSDITGAVLLRDDDEAVLVVNGSAKVWNYLLNRWTSWELPSIVYTHTLSYDPSKALLGMQAGAPTLYMLDSDIDGSTEMSWETDWMILGGDFQDSVTLHEMLFSARHSSTHGVRVELYTNYDETGDAGTYTTWTWTAAEITTQIGSIGRYTLHMSPGRQDTKAIKVRVTEIETSEDRAGMRPICLTFRFAVNGQVHENARIQGSYK